MGRRIADKLCKLSVSCAKSEILLRTRTPIDLFEAANPGCPDILKPQAVVSLGGQYLVDPGETVFSVAEDLQLQPFDIVKFNIDINPAYTLLEGSVLTVPLPRNAKLE